MMSPITAGVPSVKITVDPLTEIELTVIDVVPTETAKSPATAVVAFSASLNVRVTCVPAVFAAAELNVGPVVSITIACAPAILLVPVGNAVDVIALPAASVGADVSAYDDTVKSALLSPVPTVYVPVRVVDVAFVSTTVSPVSSVTVIDAPSATTSLIVAVIFAVLPTPNLPLAVVEENDETVGLVVSIVRLTAAEIAESTPAPVCFEVTDHMPSASVPRLQLVVATAAVKVHVTEVEPALVAVTVTVLPSVAPPTERVGVLSDVMLSEFEEPVSEPVSTSGVPGAAGKYVKPPVNVEA
jgi:hypothetical protein